jgi:hypothetical protein
MTIEQSFYTKINGAIVLAFTLICLSTYAANACSCPEPTDELAEETYGFMDYIFEGEVKTLRPKALRRSPLVTIEITRRYKGDFISSDMIFAYNSLENTCGNPLEVGQVVTLGAYDMPASQPRLTNLCAQMAVRKHLTSIGGYPK